MLEGQIFRPKGTGSGDMDSDYKTALAAPSDWGIKVRRGQTSKGKPSPFSIRKQAKQPHDRHRPEQVASKGQGRGMECVGAARARGQGTEMFSFFLT